MNRCIFKQMLLILAKGIWELLQLILSILIVLGIPALVIWGIGKLIDYLWGKQFLGGVILGVLSLVALFVVVSLIMEWYNKAKENCEGE